MNDGLSQELRMEVFAALVASQDEGVSVHDSRSQTARQFRLSVGEVERIERPRTHTNSVTATTPGPRARLTP
jgi:hypothetical protein